MTEPTERQNWCIEIQALGLTEDEVVAASEEISEVAHRILVAHGASYGFAQTCRSTGDRFAVLDLGEPR